MYRVASLAILILYVIPFAIMYKEIYALEYFMIIVLLCSFYLGGACLQKKNVYVDYNGFIRLNVIWLKVIPVIYIALNASLYFEIIRHIVVDRDFLEWTLNNAIARYSGDSEGGVFKKISTILFITYFILLGSNNDTNKIKLHYFMLFLLILAESIDLSRATILMAFVAFFVEILIRKNKFFSEIGSAKIIKLLLYGFILMSVIFLFAGLSRIQGEEDILAIMQVKIGEYIFAHYQALLLWMHGSMEAYSTYGAATFAALFKIFTNMNFQDGFYNYIDTDYGSTVIYTNIRGLISDFGYFFSVMFFFLSGFFIKYFSIIRMNHMSYFFIRAILFFIFFIFISPFTFATVFVAYILSYLLSVRMKNLIS